MTNKLDASAKDAEGKLQAAVGELSGDLGQKLKGEAKQVQASVMKAEADLQQGARTLAHKAHDATGALVDRIN